MNNNYRFFISKKELFQTEATILTQELKEQFAFLQETKLQLYVIYDVFDASAEDNHFLLNHILVDPLTDNVLTSIDTTNSIIAYEYVPGQFDARATAAEECLQLLQPNTKALIRTGHCLVFNHTIPETNLLKMKNYLINKVDSREKNLTHLVYETNVKIDAVPIYEDFIFLDTKGLDPFLQAHQLAMNVDDLKFVQTYFKEEEKRNPTETELKILDTYWSDHCRHTTFETVLSSIEFENDAIQPALEKAFEQYVALRKDVHQEKKPMTLMDMATIVAKYYKKNGGLKAVEISDEINACSVEVNINNGEKIIPCLLQFKNETHNHPTEIEPFGGASTCVGGAIRDPLSGRSYVYQALRISGAANIKEDIQQTLPNKLPQRTITTKAAQGFSSYGNQIGLATTFVKETFHDGYKAKRMEVGMVVGFVEKDWVRRETPAPGDIIFLIGGKTGRDGIGGATGSSKEQQEHSLLKSAAEVQKGNAPMERKLQRFFKNKNVCRLIKKANDFGAGGVCVAVGELADGLDIFLDRVPLKYAGLNATEIAISESQERMAVVIEEKDRQRFIDLANAENLDATHIANVTNTNRLILLYNDKQVVNLSRQFINTSGVRQYQKAIVPTSKLQDNKENPNEKKVSVQNILDHLKQKNVAGTQGMTEMFDATIGTSTVLMPYGGRFQLSPAEGSVQLIPLKNNTTTCSIVGYGFDADLSSQHPFLGGAYAVITSLAQLVAVGASYKNAYLTFQEYFKRLEKAAENWGLPVAALLGAMQAQLAFNIAAIGGKDSMSGTFKDIHVPPTLISFAVQTADIEHIISTEFKEENHFLYFVKHSPDENLLPDYEQLKDIFDLIETEIKHKNIVACSTIKSGGIAEAICKMSFGNKIGCIVETSEPIFKPHLASFVIASKKQIEHKQFIAIGKTASTQEITINQISVSIDAAIQAWQEPYESIFPLQAKFENTAPIKQIAITQPIQIHAAKTKFAKPTVVIPVFPGTNCEYDTAFAFEQEGANIEYIIFNNLNSTHIAASIQRLTSAIENAQIIAFAGGFSAGDEPDGSGKFIANVIQNKTVNAAIQKCLQRDGLILGICNGFQALIKSGLLPFVHQENNPRITLFKNDINRHVSKIVTTKITNNLSPWLSNFQIGELHRIPISHGEGKIVCDENTFEILASKGQIATQYVNLEGQATMDAKYNLNGSAFAIEGLLSPCGKIFGKMAHSERFNKGLYKNIPDMTYQNIFANAIAYFK